MQTRHKQHNTFVPAPEPEHRSSAMGNDQPVSQQASAGCRQPGPGRGVDVLM